MQWFRITFSEFETLLDSDYRFNRIDFSDYKNSGFIWVYATNFPERA